MAYSRYETKYLCLDRFSEIFGLNNVAFNQGTFEPRCHYGCMSGCDEFWYQNPWQIGGNKVTRDDVALAIQQAETDVEDFLGIPLCPEEHCITLPYNGTCFGRNTALLRSTQYGMLPTYANEWRSWHLPKQRPRGDLYFIPHCPIWTFGRETRDVVCSEAEAYAIDQNGLPYLTDDGDRCPRWVTANCLADGIGFDECELEVYVGGHANEPVYKLCGVEWILVENDVTMQTTISFRIDAWRGVKPELLEEPGSCGICLNENRPPVINLLDPNSYIESVDIVRRYFDKTKPSVEFGWEGAGGCSCGRCDICTLKYCPGCLVGDSRQSEQFVLAFPASYTEENGWCHDPACGKCDREPDFVRLYYWHGYMDRKCSTASPCFDCHELEQLIAQIAAARLLKPVCHCTCERNMWFEDLQRDMNISSRNEGSYFITADLMRNPLGFRRGEVNAYTRLLQIKENLCQGNVTTGAF
jgi:hypothetical protein